MYQFESCSLKHFSNWNINKVLCNEEDIKSFCYKENPFIQLNIFTVLYFSLLPYVLSLVYETGRQNNFFNWYFKYILIVLFYFIVF